MNHLCVLDEIILGNIQTNKVMSGAEAKLELVTPWLIEVMCGVYKRDQVIPWSGLA